MIELLSSLLSALRHTSPVIFLGLSIATGIILFVGEDVATTLGLNQLRNEYRGQIGGLFLISISVVAAQAIRATGGMTSSIVKDQLKKRKAKAVLADKQRQLHELTPDEKAYLAPYVLGDENTQYFRIDDGVVGGLQAKRIIWRASNLGREMNWAYNLQPWARDYLRENTQLLEGANPQPSGPPSW